MAYTRSLALLLNVCMVPVTETWITETSVIDHFAEVPNLFQLPS